MTVCKCKGCTRRTMTCHSTCEDYKTFRREKDEENQARRLDVEMRGYYYDKKKKKG